MDITKYVTKLVAIVTCCIAPLASAATAEYPQGYSFGGGLGLHQGDPMVQLGFNSPVLFEEKENPYSKGRYSLYADVGIVRHRNLVLKDEARLKDIDAGQLSLGVNIQHVAPHNLLAAYTKIGVKMIEAPKELSEDKNHIGGNAAFGIEFPYDHSITWLAPNGIENAFFAEVGVDYGFKRADKQPGEPDLFNGVNVMFGTRSYY